MLKADLHLHCNQDPEDPIYYPPKKLIDHCAKLGFEVLAITCHNHQYFTSEIEQYAKEKGIILIPGMERMLGIKHVLVYNADPLQVLSLNSVADLKKIKTKETLIIAPHAFYPWPNALNLELVKHQSLFDALEVHSVYTSWFNPNVQVVDFARKNDKPLVGNTDAHWLFPIGTTYTFIDAPKNKEAIIQAIKEGKTNVVTTPLSLVSFVRIAVCMMITTLGYCYRLLKRKVLNS